MPLTFGLPASPGPARLLTFQPGQAGSNPRTASISSSASCSERGVGCRSVPMANASGCPGRAAGLLSGVRVSVQSRYPG
jgi:hypothetical protein